MAQTERLVQNHTSIPIALTLLSISTSRRHSPSVSSLDDIPDARPLATLARTLSNDSMDDLVHNRRGRDREVFANPFGDENEVQTTVSETEHSEQQRRQPMPSPSGNRAYQHLFHDDLDRIGEYIACFYT